MTLDVLSPDVLTKLRVLAHLISYLCHWQLTEAILLDSHMLLHLRLGALRNALVEGVGRAAGEVDAMDCPFSDIRRDVNLNSTHKLHVFVASSI